MANPYAAPKATGVVSSPAKRRFVVRLLYLFAAIPAIYGAATYLLSICNFAANLLGTGVDFQNAFTQFFAWAGIWATMIQLPFYTAWAIASKEIPWKTRSYWIVLLWLGNMIAIPCFLYAKYFRIAGQLLTSSRTPTGG